MNSPNPPNQSDYFPYVLEPDTNPNQYYSQHVINSKASPYLPQANANTQFTQYHQTTQKLPSPDSLSNWGPELGSQTYHMQKTSFNTFVPPQLSSQHQSQDNQLPPDRSDLSIHSATSAAKTAFDIFSVVSGAQPQEYQYKMWSWMNWPLQMLKPYFQVSHSYVITKIGLVVFPFIRRDWFRKTASNNYSNNINNTPASMSIQQLSPSGLITKNLDVSFAPPREDINCPDLYIPLHAFITYVILVSIIYGIEGNFTPDILGITASSAMVTSLLELFVIRAGFFILGLGSSVPILEYLAYVGYKYIGLVCIVTGGLIFPNTNGFLIRILWLYVSISYALFTLRSLKDSLNLTSGFGVAYGSEGLLPGGGVSSMDSSHLSHTGGFQRRRVYFLLLVAAIQAALSYYLIIEPKLVPQPHL